MHLEILRMRTSQGERIGAFHWLGLVREYIIPEFMGPGKTPVFLMLYAQLGAVVAARRELLAMTEKEKAAFVASMKHGGIGSIRAGEKFRRWDALIQLMETLATVKVKIDFALV